ncbi:MAG: GGDEF domain-containing protein [Candidatus Accumulibacter sp.]|nr:GGDEF domain-containing protein [Accumulibacter sp.]
MPNSNEQLAYDILSASNIAILRRVDYKKYVLFGDVPDFYNDLFPPSTDAPVQREDTSAMLDYFEVACTTPWDHSSMMEFFIEEAEAFFKSGAAGSVSSGIWQEEGKLEEQTALIARAVRFGDDQLILIRLLREEFIDRANILRKARVQLLENRKMAKNLELFKEKSKIDGLTKILNKTTFMEILLDEIRKAQTIGASLALIMLDIDDFKLVNDTYGHLVGDKVLESLGELLLNSLRRNDIVARYGGEEFVILVPRSSEKQMSRISEKLCTNIADAHIAQLPLTASLGYTLFKPEESPQDFINRADLAMYDAKRKGKNRVCSLL